MSVYERVAVNKRTAVEIDTYVDPDDKKVGFLSIEHLGDGFLTAKLTRKQFRQVRDAIDKILEEGK